MTEIQDLQTAIANLQVAVDNAAQIEEERRDTYETMLGQGATQAEIEALNLFGPIATLQGSLDQEIEEKRLELNVLTEDPNMGSSPSLLQPAVPQPILHRAAISGQLVSEPVAGATLMPSDNYLVRPLETSVANLREGVRVFGPIYSRHLDADGGAETGEAFTIECNARGGGNIDRILLTEPGAGGITNRNILVTSDGYGRAMQTSMFLQGVYRVMTPSTIVRGPTTVITFAEDHGLTPTKTMGISINSVGDEGATPTLIGYHLATVLTSNSISIPVDTGAPIGSSRPIGGTKVSLIRYFNPTQAGGVYAGTTGNPTWNVPNHLAHASICKSITYTPLVTHSERVCSAVITIVTVPVDFDADGTTKRGGNIDLDETDPESSNHGGSPSSPALWTGIEVITRLYINPIMEGAENGFPGVMRFEVEWKFPVGMEGLAWANESYWKSDSNGGTDCPNTHLCGHVPGERTFQQKWLWRGGNNSNILLTGRPFHTDAGNKGEWDGAGPYGVFINSQFFGVAKNEDIGDGYQSYAASAAERAAVLPDAQTMGIIGIVNERNTTHKFAFASTVKVEPTAFPPSRSSTITYSRDAGDGTIDAEGKYIEGVASGGQPKDFTRNFPSRLKSRFKEGEVLKNWHYMAFAFNGAQLMTSWNGNAKGKLGMLLDMIGGRAF